jgi:N-acetyl-anhydromuramyl-L-alanine amidase AmpD
MFARKLDRVAMYMVALLLAGCAPAPDSRALPSSQLQMGGPGSGAHFSANDIKHIVNDCNSGGVYRPWRYIVLHHSAGDSGNATVFDAEHRARGWDGLGYHFVIDNGKGGLDGLIETGERWKLQKWGAHTGFTPSNEYNNYGIGICLVGDFTNSMPTQAQLTSMKQLVLELMAKYDIPPENVVGHRDAPGTNTACPGDKFHIYMEGQLRLDLARQSAMKR